MALERSVELPDDWIADEFRPTVNTSTYLLAFVVCQFKSLSAVDSKGRNFTVWARPELIHAAKYALEIGQKIIRFFEDYYEVAYPLEKTDMVAVPDFLAGAMENWGLIIYREATMLWDPKTGTAAGRQKVATVVSHEIAHQARHTFKQDTRLFLLIMLQWFGNLVTLTWWDDLWLNEGFASFVENIGVDHVHPEWRMDEQFLLEDVQKALGHDATSSSRPVIQSVHFPKEINELFDAISYNKGASVLRMMESFLGRDTFRLGLRNYLQEFKFKNTVHEDLWRSLTEFPMADSYQIWKTEFLGLGRRRRDLAKRYTLHALSLRLFHTLPVKESMVVEIDIDPSSWYVLNLRQAGFYRVHYADNNWEALTKQLLSDYKVIPVHSRAQIIDDLFSLANRGNVPYSVFLNMTKYLSNEEEYVTWETATRTLRTLTRLLAFDSSYGALLAYIRTLVDRVINQVDWNMMTENEDHLKNIPPSLRPAVYCTAIDAGGQLEWRFLYRQLKYAERDEEASGIRPSLACTRDIWIMKEYINSLLAQDNLETHDLQESLSLLATTPLGTLVMWEHIREMWKRAE
ncbi:aminopeptidase N [Paragonimus westermani]|uniref:glutamyl aminopeptidase n=1 Tax=Paragonimus westermani TaxID=34504 RepID=A0A5J4P0R2_9TREM|nr:aminopeptidase N [Paragonimus westermani]